MFKNLSFIFIICCISAISEAQTKILFDATHAETAANADWQIDADLYNVGFGTGVATIGGSGTEANPQRFPTPAQSTVTSSTSESYWKGGLSSWGIEAVKKGYQVETLPIGAALTYGNTSNAQDLSNYKVFVVCEPNIDFTTSERAALLSFVQNGGGLFMIADHDMSDRNFDGIDSPSIWNNLMVNNPFGMKFDLADFSQTTSNIPSLPGNPILNGAAGNVSQIQFSGGTTLTLDPTKNASVKGLVYKTGSSNTGNTNVMVAYSTYGQGKVIAIGDSSPSDDGTGDLNDILYDGWLADANGNHRKFFLNATDWLASGNVATPLTLTTTKGDVNCYGASTGFAGVSAAGATAPYTYKWSNNATQNSITNLAAGTYSVTVTAANATTAVASIVINQPASALSVNVASAKIDCKTPSVTLQTSVFGGTVGYIYKWNTGTAQAAYVAASAGTYTVTVTDSKGCTVANSTTVSANTAPPAFTLSQNSTTCGVICALVTLTNSAINATYKWSNNVTTANNCVTANGQYSVTVTDASNGCSATNVASITVVAGTLSAAVSATTLTCANPTTQVTSTVTGGTSPYVYTWNSNATTPNITVTASGNYTLTVTDKSNCTVIKTFTVVEDKKIPSFTVVQSSPTCGQVCAEVTLANPLPNVTYNWSNNIKIAKNCVTANGNYTVTVTNVANGCTSVSNAIAINIPSQLFVTVGVIKNATPNQQNGSASVNVTNGTAPYMYLWRNNQNMVVSTAANVSNVYGGTFTCQITDAAGCTTLFTVQIPIVSATQDVENQLIVNVYPNPSANIFKIQLDNNLDFEATLYDLNGRLLSSKSANGNTDMTFENEASGLYLLKIKVENTVVYKKIIKE